MQVVWSEPAEQYLDAIVEYIAKDNLRPLWIWMFCYGKRLTVCSSFRRREGPDVFQVPESLLLTSTTLWFMSLFLAPSKL